MTRFDPNDPSGFAPQARHLLSRRYDDIEEPAPSIRILAAAKRGDSGMVGEMLRKDPGLVHTMEPQADISRYMYSQQPPLALVAEDHGQQTLARAIGVFSATGIWNASGKWPSAKQREAARKEEQYFVREIRPEPVEATRVTPQQSPLRLGYAA